MIEAVPVEFFIDQIVESGYRANTEKDLRRWLWSNSRLHTFTMSTQQTAYTQYTDANGTRFAFRHFGKPSVVPFVMLQHFRASMDDWDPALINAIAEKGTVLLLDNAGVGRSSGQVPTVFAGWAENVIVLLKALIISEIDLLGFSRGGAAAQMVALNGGDLARARRLFLAGTGPSLGPSRVDAHVGPYETPKSVEPWRKRAGDQGLLLLPNYRRENSR